MNDETRAMSPAERLKNAVRNYAIAYADYRAEGGFAGRERNFARLDALDAAIDALAASPDSAPAQEARHLTLTKSPAGDLVAVTWQDNDHRILETVWSKYPPAQEAAVTQQPATSAVLVAWMWQHDETGRTGFVAADFDRAHWEQHNPRLAIVAPLYDAPIAPEPVQPTTSAVPRDTYLCRAWGESDLPIVQVVYSRAGIEQFIINQWLGERDGQDFDGTPTLPRVMAEFDENEGWFHAEFEIGGIAIDRVHVLTEEVTKS